MKKMRMNAIRTRIRKLNLKEYSSIREAAGPSGRRLRLILSKNLGGVGGSQPSDFISENQRHARWFRKPRFAAHCSLFKKLEMLGSKGGKGNRNERVPCGYSREAASELKLRRFAE
jgi:hypothetical protein